jgi:hypothetical protein
MLLAFEIMGSLRQRSAYFSRSQEGRPAVSLPKRIKQPSANSASVYLFDALVLVSQ